MTDAAQVVGGSLSAVVLRACQDKACPHFQSLDCPDHSRKEDLGVIATIQPMEATG